MTLTTADFPADYVTKELAVKIANDKFEAWAKENQVCTHPSEGIRARILHWDAEKCQFYCVCGKRMEIVKWTVSTQENKPSYTSPTVIR